MAYTYKAFGLIIESEILIPELMSYSDVDQADVRVVLTKKLDFSGKGIDANNWFVVEEDELLLEIDKISRFRVTHGTLIEIEPLEEGDIQSIRLFLLGSAIGGLLHQRGILPIHASAVEVNGKAILFSFLVLTSTFFTSSDSVYKTSICGSAVLNLFSFSRMLSSPYDLIF